MLSTLPIKRLFVVFGFCALAALMPSSASAQALNANISGTVIDPSGAVIPAAQLNLTSVATGVERQTTSAADGRFDFQNLPPGDYEVSVTATGFRVLQRSGISLRPNQKTRIDLQLEVGDVTETVEVTAGVAPINFENATQETGVGPDVLNTLPLLVSNSVRDITAFALLVPGVNAAGGGNSPFDARVNGGMQGGDDAVVDGASMSSIGGNAGFVNFFDIRMTPDMVGEFKLITSNYEPQWGATTSSQIVATTKSGTNEYHGGAFWYHRNTALNARAWGEPDKSIDLEHDFGAFAGGKVPGANFGNVKTFGYFLYEGYRIEGGATRPTLSIPSVKQRAGDFTDWLDGSGSLIPVFDPATTRTGPDGAIVRDQFNCMGVPNVICPSRFSNSLANQWLQHLPQPTSGGALNNFIPARAQSFGQFDVNSFLFKIDFHPNDSNHIAFMSLNTHQPADETTNLPPIIASDQFSEQYKNLIRVNWDHTFTPTLLNTFNFGWTHANFNDRTGNAAFADELPKIPGVGSTAVPPEIGFASDPFEQFGNSSTVPGASFPNGIFVGNNLTTWIRGNHTFKFGGEYWYVRKGEPSNGPGSGIFTFDRPTTGLLGINSGNPVASFLLERVSSAQTFFSSIDNVLKLRDAYMAHFGDTWKATPKLTVSMGVRWDMHRPNWEGNDNNSFFDPLRPNPGAAGRLGALVFAGTKHGDASFGRRYPESTFKKGFGPRFGIAYALNNRTVLRAGYGIFFSQAFYPGWTDGIVVEGVTTSPTISAKQGGLEPAMILSEGFPSGDFPKPPFIDVTLKNGQDPFYRDFNGNKLPYSQQWNLTIERQFADASSISLAYVATKGNRLISAVAPVNVLNPSLVSMGDRLRDEFQPGQSSLHGVPLPYEGWVDQLGCAPSVAQALLPYPQFCSRLAAMNENAGVSHFHSFQLKFQKNFSEGTYVLTSYTFSKLLTNGGSTNSNFGGTWSGQNGSFSPFERHREKGLANDDVPHNLTVAWVYELPFGRGKRFANMGAASKIAGGWAFNGIFRAVSGTPLYVRSGQCNVPGEFRARCVPALLNGANPFRVDKGSWDPGTGPLLNAAAFEPLSAFEQFGYWGAGPRMLDERLFGLTNFDVSIHKNTLLTESLNLQLRFEFFNVFNQHHFTGSRVWGGNPVVNNLSSPNFGQWSGQVTSPRVIQMGLRLEF